MQRWIASLTLIAYLVGGWVLPAIHHHGVDASGPLVHDAVCQGHAHGCHAESTQDHESTKEHEHLSSCAHSSTSEDDAECQKADLTPLSGVGYRSSATTDDCHGLCALCLARSLCSQRWTESNLAIGIAPVAKAFFGQTNFVLQRARGNTSSRGPPLFV